MEQQKQEQQNKTPIVLFPKSKSPFLQLYSVLKNKTQRIGDGQLQIESIVDSQGVIKLLFNFQFYQILTSQIQPFFYKEHDQHIEIYLETNSQDFNTGFYAIVVKKSEKQVNQLVSNIRDCFQIYNQERVKEIQYLEQKLLQNVSIIFQNQPLITIQNNDCLYAIQKSGYLLGELTQDVADGLSEGSNWATGKIVDKTKKKRKQSNNLQSNLQKQENIIKKTSKCKKIAKKITNAIDRLFQPCVPIVSSLQQHTIDCTKNSTNSKKRKLYQFAKHMSYGMTNCYKGLTKSGQKVQTQLQINAKGILEAKYGEISPQDFDNKQDDIENLQNNDNKIQVQYPQQEQQKQQLYIQQDSLDNQQEDINSSIQTENLDIQQKQQQYDQFYNQSQIDQQQQQQQDSQILNSEFNNSERILLNNEKNNK